MKRILLTLSSVLLFAASLSAQITIDKYNALPTSGTVFGRDEAGLLSFDTMITIHHQAFDSANTNYTNANFDGYGGAFVWDSNGSIHSSTLFTTFDSSGFVIMNSDGMGPNDTQRVYLTSPSFSTVGYNRLTLTLNHFYDYFSTDSIAAIMLSTNGTTWNMLQNFTDDSADRGGSTNFATETYTLDAQYLNKATVYIRFVYATTYGMYWAINDVKLVGEKFKPTFATVKPGTNMTWDLSNIAYNGAVNIYLRRSAPAPYRFADSMHNENLGAMQHTSYGLNYFTVSGIHAWGQLTYAHDVPLGGVTGNIADTFRVPEIAEIEYSNQHTKIAYPLTMNTRWKSDLWFQYPLVVRGPSFGNDTNNIRRFVTYSERDTVVGWGKMRVKSVGGNVESYIDVLQVKSVVTQRDSFYSVSTDSTEKSLFNIFLGNAGLGVPTTVTSYTRYSFMRVGELHPLVTVYTGATDTFITRVEVHMNHPWPLDLQNASVTEEALKVYPNPVSGRVVNVALAVPQDGNWSCEVLNVMGQTVASQRLDLDMGNKNAQVNLPASAAPGNYYLRFTRNGELMTVKPITVQ